MSLRIYELHLYTTTSVASFRFPLRFHARSRAGHLTIFTILTLSLFDDNVHLQ